MRRDSVGATHFFAGFVWVFARLDTMHNALYFARTSDCAARRSRLWSHGVCAR